MPLMNRLFARVLFWVRQITLNQVEKRLLGRQRYYRYG
jgi:hypothetical protein